MARCIEIKRRQVAELMRNNPGLSETKLDELIVRCANDRSVRGSHDDEGVYVNAAMAPLETFKALVRHEMTTGAAWLD